MLGRLKIAVLLIGAALTASRSLGAQRITGTCAPIDSTSARLVAAFVSIDTSHTSSDTTGRALLGMTSVIPSQILPVTDDSICTKAAVAMAAQGTQKSTSYKLYVVTLGSSYAVLDRTVVGAGYAVAWVFDRAWNYVATQQIF